jgi:hypothetical protein
VSGSTVTETGFIPSRICILPSSGLRVTIDATAGTELLIGAAPQAPVFLGIPMT